MKSYWIRVLKGYSKVVVFQVCVVIWLTLLNIQTSEGSGFQILTGLAAFLVVAVVSILPIFGATIIFLFVAFVQQFIFINREIKIFIYLVWPLSVAQDIVQKLFIVGSVEPSTSIGLLLVLICIMSFVLMVKYDDFENAKTGK